MNDSSTPQFNSNSGIVEPCVGGIGTVSGKPHSQLHGHITQFPTITPPSPPTREEADLLVRYGLPCLIGIVLIGVFLIGAFSYRPFFQLWAIDVMPLGIIALGIFPGFFWNRTPSWDRTGTFLFFVGLGLCFIYVDLRPPGIPAMLLGSVIVVAYLIGGTILGETVGKRLAETWSTGRAKKTLAGLVCTLGLLFYCCGWWPQYAEKSDRVLTAKNRYAHLDHINRVKELLRSDWREEKIRGCEYSINIDLKENPEVERLLRDCARDRSYELRNAAISALRQNKSNQENRAP